MPCSHVEVIAAVRLGDVAVRVVEVPLAARRAGVVARRRRRVHAELGHQPAAHVVVVEVAADAELGDLDLAGAAASVDPSIVWSLRMVEIADVVDVDPEFAGEILRVERRALLRALPVSQVKSANANGSGFRGLCPGWAADDAESPAWAADESVALCAPSWDAASETASTIPPIRHILYIHESPAVSGSFIRHGHTPGGASPATVSEVPAGAAGTGYAESSARLRSGTST